MDLIILIVFAALAMLLSNIKAAKKRQQEAMKENACDTEDTTDSQLSERRDPWEALLQQLNDMAKGNRCDEDEEDEEDDEDDDDENPDENETKETLRHDPEFAADEQYERPLAARTISQASNRDIHTQRPAAANITAAKAYGRSSDTGLSGIPDSAAPDEMPALCEDFDLRSAVIYSEILRPKFDNYQD